MDSCPTGLATHWHDEFVLEKKILEWLHKPSEIYIYSCIYMFFMLGVGLRINQSLAGSHQRALQGGREGYASTIGISSADAA
jgi:hypothetical protein